jgi:hypothetical protein
VKVNIPQGGNRVTFLANKKRKFWNASIETDVHILILQTQLKYLFCFLSLFF